LWLWQRPRRFDHRHPYGCREGTCCLSLSSLTLARWWQENCFIAFIASPFHLSPQIFLMRKTRSLNVNRGGWISLLPHQDTLSPEFPRMLFGIIFPKVRPRFISKIQSKRLVINVNAMILFKTVQWRGAIHEIAEQNYGKKICLTQFLTTIFVKWSAGFSTLLVFLKEIGRKVVLQSKERNAFRAQRVKREGNVWSLSQTTQFQPLISRNSVEWRPTILQYKYFSLRFMIIFLVQWSVFPFSFMSKQLSGSLWGQTKEAKDIIK
jgi:hypothetical protein